MSEGVGEQQVAELVMDRGFGDGKMGKSAAREATQEADRKHQGRAGGNGRRATFPLRKPIRSELGCDVRQRERDRGQTELYG